MINEEIKSCIKTKINGAIHFPMEYEKADDLPSSFF